MTYKVVELLKAKYIGMIVQANDGFVYVVTDECGEIKLNLTCNKKPVILSSLILEKEFKDITEEYWNSTTVPVSNSDIPF